MRSDFAYSTGRLRMSAHVLANYVTGEIEETSSYKKTKNRILKFLGRFIC